MFRAAVYPPSTQRYYVSAISSARRLRHLRSLTSAIVTRTSSLNFTGPPTSREPIALLTVLIEAPRRAHGAFSLSMCPDASHAAPYPRFIGSSNGSAVLPVRVRLRST